MASRRSTQARQHPSAHPKTSCRSPGFKLSSALITVGTWAGPFPLWDCRLSLIYSVGQESSDVRKPSS